MTLDLLTTEQVAQILKVKDRKTVRKLVKSGKLRRVIMGERSVRFRPEDVAEYVRGLPCHSPDEDVSGITSSKSAGNVIAGPHARRKNPRRGRSNSENTSADVTSLPWVKQKEPSL
jgi:excisionase family DNA binding protein